MLLEPMTGQIEQLRRRFEIDFGTDDVLMAQVSRQQWQLSVDIDAFLRPGGELMDGEGISKLIRTGSDTPTRWLDAELAQQSSDGKRPYRHRQRRPIETHEQH